MGLEYGHAQRSARVRLVQGGLEDAVLSFYSRGECSGAICRWISRHYASGVRFCWRHSSSGVSAQA